MAHATSDHGIAVGGAAQGARQLKLRATPIEPARDALDIAHVRLTVPPYRKAEFRLTSPFEPYEAPVSQLADLAARIVGVEGPIHLDEIARRISGTFGKTRTGSRISDATMAALS